MARQQYNGITLGGEVAQRTPIRMNLDAVSQSINKIDEKNKTAIEKRGAIAAALRTMKIHNSEDEWRNQYIDNIQAQIDAAASYGDYSRALNTANTLASESVSDPQLLGRVEANQKYEENLNTVKNLKLNGRIGQKTYDWWLANNKYQYIEPHNPDGSVNTEVRGQLADMQMPLADINWLSVVDTAFKAISPSSVSSSTSSSTHKKDGSGSSSSKGSSVREVKLQDILDNYDAIFQDPNLRAQATQAYNVAMYDYNNLRQKYESGSATDSEKQDYENATTMLMQNGSPVTEQMYAARMITTFAGNMAYRHTTSEKGSSMTEAPEKTVTTPSGSYNQGFFQGATTPYTNWAGPSVFMTPNYMPWQLPYAQSGVVNLFNDVKP